MGRTTAGAQGILLRQALRVVKHRQGSVGLPCLVSAGRDMLHAEHGAGWRGALGALTVALGDGAPVVVNQALDAIQPVVEALYRCHLRTAAAAIIQGPWKQQLPTTASVSQHELPCLAPCFAVHSSCVVI